MYRCTWQRKKAKGVTIADKIVASIANEEKQTYVVHKEQQQPMLHQEAQVVHEEQQQPILLHRRPPTRNHPSTGTERTTPTREVQKLEQVHKLNIN